MIRVDTSGVRGALRYLKDDATAELEKAVALAGEVAQAGARASTRWKDRTGKTRRTVVGGSLGLKGFVAAGKIGLFLDRGTKPHVIAARYWVPKTGGRKGARLLTFQVGGRWVSKRWVRHPGTKPTRFLSDAAHWAAGQLAREVPRIFARSARAAGLR